MQANTPRNNADILLRIAKYVSRHFVLQSIITGLCAFPMKYIWYTLTMGLIAIAFIVLQMYLSAHDCNPVQSEPWLLHCSHRCSTPQQRSLWPRNRSNLPEQCSLWHYPKQTDWLHIWHEHSRKNACGWCWRHLQHSTWVKWTLQKGRDHLLWNLQGLTQFKTPHLKHAYCYQSTKVTK